MRIWNSKSRAIFRASRICLPYPRILLLRYGKLNLAILVITLRKGNHETESILTPELNMLLRAAIILFLLSACASEPVVPPAPQGEYQWNNPELYQKVRLGKMTNAELTYESTIAKNTCKIESLKIPIPSPSCTQPPRQDCTGLGGFALGYCQGNTPQPRCDYSATNAARDAQIEI